MADQLTPEQQMAVCNRGGKLLISAAAGSGKTKVLVDRLLLYLTQSNGQINIDDFLIITYTKAAAAELRGKIAAKLSERLAEEPGNKHLQRQLQRLYLTKISTVHSFCADILREYAYKLDIPGDFRVADERECQILQLQVLDRLLNEAYEDTDPDFLTFLDTHELGRDDRMIPEIILKVYNSAQCHVDAEKWLEDCAASGLVNGIADVSETVWGKYLIQDLHNYLDLQIDALSKCALLAEHNGSMPKPAVLLRDTVNHLSVLRSDTLWDQIVNHRNIDYGRMIFPKDCTDLELAEKIKAVRNACKSGLEKKLTPFADASDQVLVDLQKSSSAIFGLISLVKRFASEYQKAKKYRRILDFSDLEHKMLDLLIGKNRQGSTAAAKEIGSRFVEIMVDEYQDSNAVQDAIFSALTEERQNCFMVGDVKQSIYQFRLADPGIFLEKYNSYVPAEEAEPGQGRLVMLSSNFRSAGPVIAAVNDVFSTCMSPEVGGLSYGEAECLKEGIPHISVPEPEVELSVISVQQDTYAEEAAYTADRILDLLDGSHTVRDGENLRPITADDIVILLRSPGSVGAEFQYALESRGIRVNSGNGMDLLQTEEIGFIRAMLEIISNPMQDIPLIAVLSSRIFCFTADDLASIRAGSRRRTFYEALRESESEKAKHFVSLLQSLREEAKLCTLSQLIDRICFATKMDSIFGAMDDGAVKSANLQAFYRLVSDCESSNYQELGQFLDYLTSLEKKGLMVSDDRAISGAVTIMSIHKSKGLEFPVVFLCGLSRDFNREDARAQVLCHKELGIGVNCVDLKNRVRYPSAAKKAIAAKIVAEGQSEEMRVLYVAMTRAKDRLIMTYAVKNPEKDISDLVNRMDLCNSKLLTLEASCPGTWVLMTALRKAESGALFALGGKPEHVSFKEPVWSVKVETALETQQQMEEADMDSPAENYVDIERLEKSLSFRYSHTDATRFPSKQTATQLKGRQKDQEAAENSEPPKSYIRKWRKPSFSAVKESDGASHGNTVHAIMQHILFENCAGLQGIQEEIRRIATDGFITSEAADTVDPAKIWAFFESDIGMKLRKSKNVIREFKFSILDDAAKYDPGLLGEQILLQGVVDCAIIESEGITVLDFKTDRVTDATLDAAAEQYRMQVTVYAEALSKIYEKRILSAQLYFFNLNRFYKVI